MKTIVILIVIGLLAGLLLALAWHDRGMASNPHNGILLFRQACWSGQFDPGWIRGTVPGTGVYRLTCYKADGVTEAWRFDCGPMEDHAVILSETIYGRPKVACWQKPEKP